MGKTTNDYRLKGTNDSHNVVKLLDKIMDNIEQLNIAHPSDYPITVSIGAAFSSNEMDKLSMLYEKADEVLYKAKRKGKNQYAIACD